MVTPIDVARERPAYRCAPLVLRFQRHSVLLSCGKAQVKCSLACYGKLAMLHRRHAPAAEASPAPHADAGGEPEAAAVTAGIAACGGEAADNGREALHLRLFTLLLRYKSLRAPRFERALGPPVWRVLQQRLGVAVELFAGPVGY